MPDKRYVLPDRVAAAITNLALWRKQAKPQGAINSRQGDRRLQATGELPPPVLLGLIKYLPDI